MGIPIQACIRAAKSERRYAHSMMRLARIQQFPNHWDVEHRYVMDAKAALRNAIGWIILARAERSRMKHDDDMRELR